MFLLIQQCCMGLALIALMGYKNKAEAINCDDDFSFS